MPLKKPKSIPDISKSRKKSIDQLKEAIPEPKEGELEYRCGVYFFYNPIDKIQKYIFHLETVKLFSILNYELVVEHQKNKKEIDISILGITTKNTYLNKANPASAEISFEELYGEHTLNIIKQDGSVNSALIDFNVFKKEIKIVKEFIPKKKNNRKFCEFFVAQEKFKFSPKGLL